ncbi:MAG TPA: hypothetical protein VMK65_05395 [Longimicrobiales bacterium]|nr:hypothetical protein [Longimicrobiales bacterium]
MTKKLDELRSGKGGDGQRGSDVTERLQLAAIGVEAEFALFVDDVQVRPEEQFGDPRAFIRGPLMHRTGTSYHLPTGGVIYFDTGVIELATPVIELDRGCAARAGRSLWESLRFVRGELDAWEAETGRSARLVGFSTHYNISFELTREQQGRSRTVRKLALLLAHLLPVPVMLLATNRRSTGVGVRPRGDRIEITVDFTPSAALMIATGTLITGIVRDVMRWDTFELSQLEKHDIPVIDGFAPVPHTSRKGWLARWDCYPANPFQADPDEAAWRTTAGDTMSLRAIAGRITRRFWRSIRRVSDPFTFRLIGSVMRGKAPSLLDLDDRPPEYEDVGRLCNWNDLFPPSELSRSRYERVLIHAIAGRRLHMEGHGYTPVGMRGWSQVVFRRDGGPERYLYSIDYLLDHLDDWEEGEARAARAAGRRRRARRDRAKR